jgi:DNA-binding CsgD family transcriptional regulator/Tfp pilus assembly protein PilF
VGAELLVGREEELERVELLLGVLEDGPRGLIIEGEAGAGKTSIWEAALAAATGRGLWVLSARPGESEASYAYAALGDLLAGHVDTIAALPARQRRALEVALLVGDEEGEAPDQHSVALGLLGMVRHLADERPLVLAIDDVQWLDAPSELVLRFASRRLGALRVGVLVAWRTYGSEPVPLGLERTLDSDRLRLRPLSLGAIQRLIKDRLGFLPPRPALRRLYELAGGNPFFALELGRALRDGTIELQPDERLPVALEALVDARLGSLSADARDALAGAAALAQPTVELVEAVTGVDQAALDEAVRAQVVHLHDGRVRFTHPLLASGAYAARDASRRRDLHARAAEHVSNPEERARHLALAATGPDERVASALEDAARRAEARGAPPAAAELYERAVRLTPPEDGGAELRRKIKQGFCTFQTGDGRRARALLDEVVEALGPGPDRARALISLARVRSYDDDLRAAEELFRQALAEAQGDDEILAGAGENLAAILFRLRERLEEAIELTRAAERAARTAGDTGWLAETLGSRLLAQAALGRTREAAETLEAALEIQPACHDHRALAQPLFQVAVVWLWWDELERAKEAFEHLAERAREMGEEGSLPYVLVLSAQVECVRGDFALAARHADEGYELAEQGGQTTLGAYLLALRAAAHAGAGEADAARAAAGRALELADRTSGRPAEHFARGALGLVELSVGRPKEASAALGPLVEFLRRERIVEPGTARVVPDQIEALIGLGDLDEAGELLEWFTASTAHLKRPSALAAAARCRGLLLAERGDAEGALAELERAVELSEQSPVPLERGRALLCCGAMHRRTRHKREARTELEGARTSFEQLGASAWAERAHTELASVGGRGRTPGLLTPTEGRVAELVAEGLQTKQVAAALFVSPKTVEGHLTNIYAKLGVHSRTELARRMQDVRSPQ